MAGGTGMTTGLGGCDTSCRDRRGGSMSGAGAVAGTDEVSGAGSDWLAKLEVAAPAWSGWSASRPAWSMPATPGTDIPAGEATAGLAGAGRSPLAGIASAAVALRTGSSTAGTAAGSHIIARAETQPPSTSTSTING